MISQWTKMLLEICNGMFTRIIKVKTMHQGVAQKNLLWNGSQNKKVWEVLD